jgi:molybdopterin converting factor small subunit
MQVTVRYFAVLRELRGVSVEAVDLPAGTSAAAAFALLFPAFALPVAFAVNEAAAPGSTVLAEGDELVFLPPLGGG